jgi:hypothetical protein
MPSLEVGPLDAPLTYPGPVPEAPAVLVTRDDLTEAEPGPAPPGRWLTDGRALDDVLAGLDAAPIGARHPVVAIGSNASPAQLRRKFVEANPVIPMARARVGGIVAGLSAHVSRPGYIAATPVRCRGEVSDLFVTWLDDDELRILDKTEPNYDRIRLPRAHPVELPGGRPLVEPWIYVSHHGYLTDPRGNPRRLSGQRELIESLLAEVPGLTGLAGADVREWLQRTRDESVREQIRELFRSAGVMRALVLR